MEECLFCRIVRGDVPAEIVYDDDRTLAFRDIVPQAPTHVLIIPKRHIAAHTELAERDRELIGHIHWVAARLARQEGIAEDGYRVVVNCGENGHQTVHHLHFHLLGGRSLGWPPG